MGAVVAVLVPNVALASRPKSADPARTYVNARAAALSGDHARSAQLFAQLADSADANEMIVRQAISEAIGAGAMRLALRLAGKMPEDSVPVEARLLRAAEELRRDKGLSAIAHLSADSELGNIGFIEPVLSAWVAADKGDLKRALQSLDRVQRGNPLISSVPEHRALILLKFKRIAEADPFVQKALETAGGRGHRLRFAFADAYERVGDRQRALMIIDGLGTEVGRARERLLAGRSSGLAINNARTAFSEILLRLSIDLNRMNSRPLPVAFSQIARYVAPSNSSAAILLGIFLENRDRIDEAIEAFRTVDPANGLAAQARDSEARALVDAERIDEALRVAQAAASAPGADISDFARLGDTLSSAKRHDEAAAAYARAIALSEGRRAEERWPLLLLRASALESAGRWQEARQALGAALALAPQEPLILNFLGYTKLERGEDLDAAEAMIRKASELAPDDASITDSLGWALFKRGRVDQAIETLQRAALGDPLQSEIHEHLGDALYTAGRKFEARFAWRAALTVAEDEEAKRIRAKIEHGLTSETAAP